MSAIGSMIWERPGLALLGALALLCLILLFPILAAARRKAHQRPPPTRREPQARRNGYGDEYDDRSQVRPVDRAVEGFGNGPRNIFRLASLGRGAWFVLGMIAGIGLTVLWVSAPSRIASLVSEFNPKITAGPVAEPAPAPARITAAAPAPKKAAPAPKKDVAPIAKAPPSPSQGTGTGGGEPAIDEKLNAYIDGLKRQVPIQVGPEIRMVDARAENDIVTLAFTIDRAVPDGAIPSLQLTLEQRFKAGVCTGNASQDIRSLNDSGVSFHLVYADLMGKTIAKMTAAPNFCATAAQPR